MRAAAAAVKAAEAEARRRVLRERPAPGLGELERAAEERPTPPPKCARQRASKRSCDFPGCYHGLNGEGACGNWKTVPRLSQAENPAV